MSNQVWTDELPYFPRNELDCRGSRQLDAAGEEIPGTGVILLDLRFAVAFPYLRMSANRPLSPTSVCRTSAHNLTVGGHRNSLHQTKNPKWPTSGTMAADISWWNWSAQDSLDFARLAWKLGWSVGLHKTFCHVDRRGDLNLRELPRAVFLYGEWDERFNREDIF